MMILNLFCSSYHVFVIEWSECGESQTVPTETHYPSRKVQRMPFSQFCHHFKTGRLCRISKYFKASSIIHNVLFFATCSMFIHSCKLSPSFLFIQCHPGHAECCNSPLSCISRLLFPFFLAHCFILYLVAPSTCRFSTNTMKDRSKLFQWDLHHWQCLIPRHSHHVPCIYSFLSRQENGQETQADEEWLQRRSLPKI